MVNDISTLDKLKTAERNGEAIAYYHLFLQSGLSETRKNNDLFERGREMDSAPTQSYRPSQSEILARTGIYDAYFSKSKGRR